MTAPEDRIPLNYRSRPVRAWPDWLSRDKLAELLIGLGDCSQQLRRWRAIHDHVRRFGKHIAWVDLSVSNNVPARFVDATLAPPVPRKINKPSRKRHV